jgi:hypothetical protein
MRIIFSRAAGDCGCSVILSRCILRPLLLLLVYWGQKISRNVLPASSAIGEILSRQDLTWNVKL